MKKKLHHLDYIKKLSDLVNLVNKQTTDDILKFVSKRIKILLKSENYRSLHPTAKSNILRFK